MDILKLRKWLADGKTDRVLEGLLASRPPIDQDLHEEAMLLSARYESLARQKRAGMVKFQDENLELAHINAALQEILKRLEKHPKRGFFNQPVAKWGVVLLLAIGVVGAIARFSGWPQPNVSDKKDEANVAKQTPAENKPETMPAAPVSTPVQSVPARTEPRANPGVTRQGATVSTSSPADTTLVIACKSNKGRTNLSFVKGETMRFYFKVNQPCTVRTIYKLADGRLVLLDNDRPVSVVQAGKWLEIGEGFEVSEPFGAEQVYVFAQTSAFEPLVTSMDADGYLFIREGLPEALRKSRGFKKKQRFAENSIELSTGI